MRVSIPSGIAAVLLLGVAVISLNHTSPSASAAEQLQEIVAANNAYKGWIHVQITAERRPDALPAGVPFPSKVEYHLNTKDGTHVSVRHIEGQREIALYSPARSEVVNFASRAGEIQIGSLTDDMARSFLHEAMIAPTNLGQWLELLKTQTGRAPQEVSRRRDGEDDRYDVVLFKDLAEAQAIGAKSNTVFPTSLTLWVEPASKRVVRMRYGEPISAMCQVSYGEPEIRDIYDLDVPRTAKVIDNRLAADLKTVMDRLDARVAKGFGDHVALVMSGDRTGAFLHVYASQGPKWLAMQYRIGKSPRSRLPDSAYGLLTVPADWPSVKPAELLGQIRQAAPTQYFIMDGDHGWAGWYDINKQSYPDARLIQAKERPSLIAQLSVAGEFIWPTRDTRNLLAPQVRGELLRDRDHPGLLGLKVERPAIAEQKNSRSENTTWFDPARDDMPVEKVWRLYGPDQKTVSIESRTAYLEYGRLANGQWYPTKWREDRIDSPQGRPATTSSDEYVLQIVPEMVLDSAWFVPPKR